MARKSQEQEPTADPVTRRLDALLRIVIEVNKPQGKEGFSDAKAARLLKSVGLVPKEIAMILGKKRATDLSKYFYSKKKR